MTKKSWVKVFAAAAAVVILGYGCFSSFQNQVGVAATAAKCPVKGLPVAAKDISFFLPGAFGPNECYEFTIDEAGFREWVSQRRARDPDIGPIEESGFSLLRYDVEAERFEVISVTSGLVSQWKRGDQGLDYGYDRGAQKAYFHYHSR